MSKAIRVVLITIGSIVVLGGGLVFFATRGMAEIRAYKLPVLEMNSINDGEYEGSCTISRWAVTVKVTVKSHKIDKVAIDGKMKTSAPKELVDEIVRNVIEQQSVDIDAVSGASITTRAYMIAIADAIMKGKTENKSF